MEETDVIVVAAKPPRAAKKHDSPKHEAEEGAMEIKLDDQKWTRAPVKVEEPTFKPKINKMSKDLDRKVDVVELL